MDNPFILKSKHFDSSNFEMTNISKDKVGQKGIGLLNCPAEFTPPFIIIPSAFYKLWQADHSLAQKSLKELCKVIINYFRKFNAESYIVRSSAEFETFDERGFYSSSLGGISNSELESTIIEIINKNIEYLEEASEINFALIVQRYEKPKYCGHLSNERRISRRRNNWLLEFVNEKGEFKGSRKFNLLPQSITQININLNCKNLSQAIKVLKILAGVFQNYETRMHVEWIWDGTQIWIVQLDSEKPSEIDSEPGSKWNRRSKITDQIKLNSFNTVDECAYGWKKIKCVQLFKSLGLPFGDIHILEDKDTILNLSRGERDLILTEDLNILLDYPIVIRMDVKDTVDISGILLPRTETIFKIEDAYDFLIANSKKFIDHGISPNDFCFLIHKFIISKSCALAFTKPDIPRIRVDSTWGIVDGLYYHPHDSFEVNLNGNKTKKRIRCKTEFLDVDNNGNWISRHASKKWDWSESLTKKQLLNIADYTSKISKSLESPVTVMYFVDIDTSTGYPTILPWFFTTDEIPDSSEKFTDVIFSEKKYLLQNISDFDKFKNEFHIANKITLKLKLNPDLLRDRELIEDIGEFAYTNNIPIELEGSILSHTYYILKKIGAKVKCIDPFEPKYKKHTFYKLVRDKIPIAIELKGEKVKTYQIASSQLLKFLKIKAVEEAFELFWETDEDNIVEELADIFEVIKGVSKVLSVDMSEIENIANKKSDKKGGFEKGIFLLETEEQALIDIINSENQIKFSNEIEIPPKEIKKSIESFKQHRIVQNSESSITIPYVLTLDKDIDSLRKKVIRLNNNVFLNITYLKTGIKLTVSTDKSEQNPRQMTLFDH